MTYISSARYRGEIDAIRLMTIDRYHANDFKLHTLKRRYLLSKLGETSNDIDHLEYEMLEKVDLSSRADITKQNRLIDDSVAYRKNILQGLVHEDRFLAKFGENKPYVESSVFFEKLRSRAARKATVVDLELSRKYILSKIGEISEVIHRIERMIAIDIQRNEIEDKNRHIEQCVQYRNKLAKAFIQLKDIDKLIAETKK